jgi:hypothetical protein
MATMNAESEPPPQVVFRPGKKRKPYRQRPEGPEQPILNSEIATDNAPPATNSAPVTPALQNEDEEGLSVAEVIRLRNARRHKHGGVGFRPEGTTSDDKTAVDDEITERSLVLHDGAEAGTQPGPETAVLGGISKRFAPQTGLVGELVNKHM